MARPTVDPAQDAALISQISAQQLGPDPAAAAGAPGMAAPAPQPADQRGDPRADNPTTKSEAISSRVSPKTEADQSREEAFIEVEIDGKREVLSASQIAGIKSRYRDLNFKNMNMKEIEPAVDLIQNMVNSARQNGNNVSGQDVAQFLQSAIQAFVANPTMGQQSQAAPATPGGQDVATDDFERELAQWERDNAVSVPPMYRNAAKMMNQLMAENQQMKMTVSQLLQQAGAINQEAGQQVQSAQQQTDQAYRQQAANNLNLAQQQFQLPDDAQDDFFDFAFGRGYTIEDFIDRDLTVRIMQDFSANRATPEMERLRALNQRRQAFTGASSSSPSMGGSPASPSADDALMQQMAQAAMAKRGMR
jgi:hypothetical protein